MWEINKSFKSLNCKFFLQKFFPVFIYWPTKGPRLIVVRKKNANGVNHSFHLFSPQNTPPPEFIEQNQLGCVRLCRQQTENQELTNLQLKSLVLNSKKFHELENYFLKIDVLFFFHYLIFFFSLIGGLFRLNSIELLLVKIKHNSIILAKLFRGCF